MKRRVIPGMFQYEQENEYIDFEKSPFYVNRLNQEWRPEKGNRRGLISATGMSGTNAYAVIEEYVEEKPGIRDPKPENQEIPIVLSAKSKDRLREMVENLRVFTAQAPAVSLGDLAYTLHGRETFRERLTFMAADKEELEKKLARFMEGKDTGVEEGEDVEWEGLYREGKVRRISGLPSYPFAKRRCWVETNQEPLSAQKDEKKVAAIEMPKNFDIMARVKAIFSRVLRFSSEELEGLNSLQEMGIGSVNAVELLEAINLEFDLNLPVSAVFEWHDLQDLAETVREETGKKEGSRTSVGTGKRQHFSRQRDEAVAVVGVSCRCAQADNPNEFWELLRQGRNGVEPIERPDWNDFFRQASPDKKIPVWGGGV